MKGTERSDILKSHWSDENLKISEIAEKHFIKKYHWKEVRCCHYDPEQMSRHAFQTPASQRPIKAHMTKSQMISGIFHFEFIPQGQTFDQTM